MSKKANEKGHTQWVIRALILLLFCLSLLIAVARLMEWNEERLRAEELEKEKERLEAEIGDLENALDNGT